MQSQTGDLRKNGISIKGSKDIITLILTDYAKRKEKERSQDGHSQTQKQTEEKSSQEDVRMA